VDRERAMALLCGLLVAAVVWLAYLATQPC
jgi:hypothetical protein